MSIDSNEWLLRSLRVSAFSQPAASMEKPELDKLFGIEVESLEIRGPLKESSQVGSLGVGKAVIGQSVGRLDFVWHVDEELSSQSSDLVGLGEIRSAADTFLQPIKSWLAARSDICRVAIGINILLPVKDRDQAYLRLDELIPELSVDSTKVGELMLQLNRWLDLDDVDGAPMRCNRLSRWNALRRNFGQMTVGPNGILVPIGNRVEQHSVSGDLDFNSAADRVDPLSAESVVRLLDLLMGEALQVLGCGD